MTQIRMPAEWEEQSAVMLALPHYDTDWVYVLDEVIDQYRRLVEALTTNGVRVLLLARSDDEGKRISKDCPAGSVIIVEVDFNDTWVRDYGPVAVEKDGRVRALDFGFNGWGLKFAADKDNLVNLRLSEMGYIHRHTYRNERDFVLEGGSIESDGKGTILTTSRCLCSPNRNGGKSKEELNGILASRLGASHVLWLDYGALQGDDTDSHIDTLARLAPGDTIIFTGCRDMDDPHFEELLRMRAQLTLFRTKEGNPFNLLELPLPSPVTSPDGERLPATYANYLVTPEAIFMPTYAQPAIDNVAAQTLRVAFPDHRIVTVDCRTLLLQHGSLHCATMQLYPDELNPISWS